MQSVDDHIIEKVLKEPPGTLVFVEDFLYFGSAKTVGKALERLVKSDKVQRVARGIYGLLPTHPVWGVLQPTTEQIAKAISRRDKARITPTGTAALNAFGLSTQVPSNVVYLTDGAARTIKIGDRKIVFKKASPRNLSTIGKISTLAIQAFKAIGNEHVTKHEIDTILKELEKETPSALEHDIQLAPEWIRVILRKSIKRD
ncbi:MAG: hypothetical protein J7578_02425 [Chitinophagaceae bacterium]|nr:hypothetical protein [Chitinophagaceae bacterium]